MQRIKSITGILNDLVVKSPFSVIKPYRDQRKAEHSLKILLKVFCMEETLNGLKHKNRKCKSLDTVEPVVSDDNSAPHI